MSLFSGLLSGIIPKFYSPNMPESEMTEDNRQSIRLLQEEDEYLKKVFAEEKAPRPNLNHAQSGPIMKKNNNSKNINNNTNSNKRGGQIGGFLSPNTEISQPSNFRAGPPLLTTQSSQGNRPRPILADKQKPVNQNPKYNFTPPDSTNLPCANIPIVSPSAVMSQRSFLKKTTGSLRPFVAPSNGPNLSTSPVKARPLKPVLKSSTEHVPFPPLKSSTEHVPFSPLKSSTEHFPVPPLKSSAEHFPASSALKLSAEQVSPTSGLKSSAEMVLSPPVPPRGHSRAPSKPQPSKPQALPEPTKIDSPPLRYEPRRSMSEAPPSTIPFDDFVPESTSSVASRAPRKPPPPTPSSSSLITPAQHLVSQNNSGYPKEKVSSNPDFVPKGSTEAETRAPRKMRRGTLLEKYLAAKSKPNPEKQRELIQNLEKVPDKKEKADPRVVACIEFIYREALKEAGIFRESAQMTRILDLKETFKKEPNHSLLTCKEPHVVAGYLKLYFREADPLFSEDLIKEIELKYEADDINGAAELLSTLPRRKEELILVLEMLGAIAEQSIHNKMNAYNLAVCWGPTLFRTITHNDHLTWLIVHVEEISPAMN